MSHFWTSFKPLVSTLLLQKKNGSKNFFISLCDKQTNVKKAPGIVK